MKKKILLLSSFLLVFNLSCTKKEVDTSQIDKMIKVTDSLLQELSVFQSQLIDSVYRLSGKKLIDIGPDGRLTPKDSLDFYQLLFETSSQLHDIFQYSQKEILFSHYQLESIKEELIKEGKPTDQIIEQISKEADVLELLKQRIDSSILLMDESINQIYFFLGDTLSLTLKFDSIQ